LKKPSLVFLEFKVVMFNKTITALFLALTATVQAAFAQSLAASALPEEVIMIKKSGLFGLEIETTFFKPDGPGPFPLVVINHGKAAGDPRFQERSRYPIATRYFLERGYAVALPMRQGFSKSSGSYIGGGCNVESNGVAQAEDVKLTLDHFTKLPFIDSSKILIAGQSHGGLTTMAFGTFDYPGVKGLVNFAGGLRQDQCAGWESVLGRAFGSYGRNTKIPSLWFYGDNDSYWTPETWQNMFSRYSEGITKNASAARMVAFGRFVVDAHSMFGHLSGREIWQPEVTQFLKTINMPSEITLPQYSSSPKPVASGFAAIDDVAAVPNLDAAGRLGYERYLTFPLPRAFALSPSGVWGTWRGGDDPLVSAINNCNAKTPAKDCRGYAADSTVIWIKK
jgi:dienelactone hydrolase